MQPDHIALAAPNSFQLCDLMSCLFVVTHAFAADGAADDRPAASCNHDGCNSPVI